MKKSLKVLLITVICYINSYSQIDNFTLSVTPTNETCTANGKLTFSVSNTLPGSTVIYTIYKLPNLVTPITVTSVSPFTGLNSGTYRVVATQTLGNQSSTKQQDVVITDQRTNLTYQVNGVDEVCGLDGKLTITILTGNVFNYEIISGPIIRPLQTSNVFNNLSAGVYQIRVFDVCGEGVVQTYQLFHKNTALNLTLKPVSMAGCNSVSVGFGIAPLTEDGIVKYPLQVTTLVTSQTGIITTNNDVVTSGTNFQAIVPYYSQQPYNYTITVVDGCGITYTLNGVVNGVSPTAIYSLESQDCDYKKVTLYNVSSVTLVSAPATFSTSLPINYSSQIVNSRVVITNLTAGTYVLNVVNVCGIQQTITFEVVIDSPLDPYYTLFNRTCVSSSVLIFGVQQLIMITAPATYNVALPHDYSSLINPANYAGFSNLPIGVYQFSTIDMCGQPKPLTIVINPISESPIATVLEGCDEGLGSLKITGQITTITLTSAPASYSNFAIPHNFTSSLISNSSALVIGLLPPGTYVFKTTNACNVEYTLTAQVFGLIENSTASIIPNCGSYNVNVIEDSNSSENTYWLQKLNTTTNDWVHPDTNVVYPNGTLPIAGNSIELIGNGTVFNLTALGQFRVLKAYKTYMDNTIASINCFRVLAEFEFTGQPSIKEVLSISCGATFEVLVTAEGVAPLQYRITLKNGQPFVIQNGTSNYFANLEPAIYNFQIEDACGNIVNRIFEIINPNPITITASTVVCNGDTLTMTVPTFSFLEYQWWKDNNISTILSTTNELTIASFNTALNNGTYHVRIVYPNNPSSCLNQELTYTIALNVSSPNAGQGSTNTYCGSQGTIDLFTLLQGSYQTDGVWTETTNSGMLTNNLWNSTSITFGTYLFNYRVTGSCNQFANSVVSVTLFSIPNAPIATADAIVCESSDIHLYASTVTNANYFWTGPNGYTSTQQNPLLTTVSQATNGTYTVYVTQNNCESDEDSVAIVVNPLPDFTLNQECVGKDYVVTAVFDENNTSGILSWIGPDAFSSNQNPIIITRAKTGIYSLTVTNPSGCTTTKDIDVIRTFCEIPNMITPNNDGSNEELNLIGFDVNKIEIFNRWGRLVYEKNNYSNEWHGQNQKGEKLPDGTYFYLITLETNEVKNGWIFVSGN